MRVRRPAKPRDGRRLGIIFLIFSLVHTPLPEPDFHNIRHKDAPGEVCEHHDHLLRWHPDASLADDVAVLHWHWFLPQTERSDAGPADGPALHAHVSDDFTSTLDDGPRILEDDSSRFNGRQVFPAPLSPLDLPSGRLAILLDPGLSRGPTLRAAAAPCASLQIQLQRWTC